MEYFDFKNELHTAFEKNDLTEFFSDYTANKFYEFCNLLIETNKVINLTSITDETEVIYKHFTDCVMIAKYIPQNTTVIDVGCGGGFPTLPLAIVRPDIHVTAIDSTSKKITVVKKFISELELQNVTAISARAEEFVLNNRERFDVCVSRAVASLQILDELCIPLVKKGGLFLPMKGAKFNEELSLAANGIFQLGATLKNTINSPLISPDGTSERYIAEIQKTSTTPSKYPRKYGLILKKPL